MVGYPNKAERSTEKMWIFISNVFDSVLELKLTQQLQLPYWRECSLAFSASDRRHFLKGEKAQTPQDLICGI
jgi:hypothetical protein